MKITVIHAEAAPPPPPVVESFLLELSPAEAEALSNVILERNPDATIGDLRVANPGIYLMAQGLGNALGVPPTPTEAPLCRDTDEPAGTRFPCGYCAGYLEACIYAEGDPT